MFLVFIIALWCKVLTQTLNLNSNVGTENYSDRNINESSFHEWLQVIGIYIWIDMFITDMFSS